MAEAANLEAKLYNTYQYNNHSVTDYVYKYLSVVDYVQIAGDLPGYTDLAYLVYAKSVGCEDVKALDTTKREIAAQQYLTAFFSQGLNKQRFAQLEQNVNNSYVLGQDLMPQSFQEELQLTAAFRNLPTTSGAGGGGPNGIGLTFTQTAQPGGTKNDSPPGGTKPQGDQKGLGKKKNRMDYRVVILQT